MDSGGRTLLLFDGLCPLCHRAVRLVLARDRTGSIRFAPLQGETARVILARHPALAGVDSLVLVESGEGGDEVVRVRSDAVLRLAQHLGGAWRAARVFRVLPRALRDGAYDLFARLRSPLFGRYASCPAPDPAHRERFLP